MQAFAKKHPVLSSLLFILVSFAVLDGTSLLWGLALSFLPYVESDSLYYLTEVVIYCLGLASALLLLHGFGLLAGTGFGPKGLAKGIWVGAFLLLVSVYDFWSYLMYLDPNTFTQPSTAAIVFCLLHVLLIGLLEETVFRGGVLRLLLQKWGGSRRGILLSVLLSSLFFGLVHLTNWLYYPHMFWSTMSQIIYAFFAGVLFCAIYLRCGNLWAVSLLHAAFNASLVLSLFSEEAAVLEFTDIPPAGALYNIITCLPYLLLGLFLLRKVRPNA